MTAATARPRLRFTTLRRVIAYDSGTGEVLAMHDIRVAPGDGARAPDVPGAEGDLEAVRQATARVHGGREVDAVIVAPDFRPSRNRRFRVDPETGRIEPEEGAGP